MILRFLAIVLAASAAHAGSHDGRTPWAEPRATPAATSSDEYAWRLFVAIDWPADPAKRAADPALPLGADRPAVWETWKSTADIYLKDGIDPGPWDGEGNSDRARESSERFETVSALNFTNLRHIVNGRMVALADPLPNSKRLTEVRVNRVSFEYIRAHELYDVDGQLRSVAGGRVVRFPSVRSKSRRAGDPSARSKNPATTR